MAQYDAIGERLKRICVVAKAAFLALRLDDDPGEAYEAGRDALESERCSPEEGESILKMLREALEI